MSEPDRTPEIDVATETRAQDRPALRLADLKNGVPVCVTGNKGGTYAEAASVCLHMQGHRPHARIVLDGDFSKEYVIEFEAPSEETCRCYNEPRNAAEDGAHAVTFLTLLDLTDYTVVEKSRIGPGVDWYLGYDGQLFQHAARLEVSGIMRGSISEFNQRVRQKITQTKKSDGEGIPAYVSVTEFGTPRTRLLKRA